jgi:hypothetical protein
MEYAPLQAFYSLLPAKAQPVVDADPMIDEFERRARRCARHVTADAVGHGGVLVCRRVASGADGVVLIRAVEL